MSRIIPIRGSLVDRCHPLVRDLVMCHAFNEGGGNFLFDASGNARHGDTWNNSPVWQSGESRVGHAVRFGDSDKSNIAISGSGWLISDEPFSASIWFYGTAWPENRNICGLSSGSNFQASVIVPSGPNIRGYCGGAATRGETVLSLNRWYHYAFVFNGIDQRVYLDGRQDGEEDATSGGYDAGDYFMYGHTGDNEWEGLLSNGALWKRVLSPVEIMSLYREPWAMFDRPRPMAIRQRKYARVLK